MKKLGFLLVGMLLFAADLCAQGCVSCSNTAANLNHQSAKGLNDGIVYLAAIPLLLIASLGYYWYRHSKLADE